MHGIKFYFSTLSASELYRVEFQHPLNSERIVSVRGKSGGLTGTGESFQWTPAVKALTLLVLRARAAAWVDGAESDRRAPQAKLLNSTSAYYPLSKSVLRSVMLEGDPGTPASSLDNALGKEPAWLVEMFGKDSAGTPFCRRLFRRSNPDRRFPGPVAVGLNSATWDGLGIAVERDGIPLLEPLKVLNLSQEIELGWRTYDRSNAGGKGGNTRIKRSSGIQLSVEPVLKPPAQDQRAHSSTTDTPLQAVLRECYLFELEETLGRTDIFNRVNLNQTVESAASDESFVRVAGKSHSLVSQIDLQLSGSARLGIGSDIDARLLKRHTESKPLSVAGAVALFGGIALFEYLKSLRGLQIDLDFEFPHAVEIVRQLIAGRFSELPDVLILGVPPTATLLSHPLGAEYCPLMLMPSVTQKIVSPTGDRSNRRGSAADFSYGRFLLMGDDPSHPSFMFDTLKRRGFLNDSAISTAYLEPDETVSELKQGDPDARAILFFPYYDLNRIFNGCNYVSNPISGSGVVVAMVHRRIAADQELIRALDVALRDAWLSLRASEAERKILIDRFIGDPRFVKAVSRFGGLHNLEGARISA